MKSNVDISTCLWCEILSEISTRFIIIPNINWIFIWATSTNFLLSDIHTRITVLQGVFTAVCLYVVLNFLGLFYSFTCLFYIKMISKHYGVLLSFPLIDFYNDSGWTTLSQNLKYTLKIFEPWWSRWSSFMPTNVLGADSSLGLCSFVKRFNVVPLHMNISLNVSVQHPSASLFLSLCYCNFTLKISLVPNGSHATRMFFVIFIFVIIL